MLTVLFIYSYQLWNKTIQMQQTEKLLVILCSITLTKLSNKSNHWTNPGLRWFVAFIEELVQRYRLSVTFTFRVFCVAGWTVHHKDSVAAMLSLRRQRTTRTDVTVSACSQQCKQHRDNKEKMQCSKHTSNCHQIFYLNQTD